MNPTITSVGSINGYGIYNFGGKITMETGTIDISGTNAYGIYIDSTSAEVILGHKETENVGTEQAIVTTDKPLVKAMGTTSGIGVKKINGRFEFYDGRLIGRTYAKPDITSTTEERFEARFYIVDELGNETRISSDQESNYNYEYEYCILEYQG